jgi:hypothetical protein
MSQTSRSVSVISDDKIHPAPAPESSTACELWHRFLARRRNAASGSARFRRATTRARPPALYWSRSSFCERDRPTPPAPDAGVGGGWKVSPERQGLKSSKSSLSCDLNQFVLLCYSLRLRYTRADSRSESEAERLLWHSRGICQRCGSVHPD